MRTRSISIEAAVPFGPSCANRRRVAIGLTAPYPIIGELPIDAVNTDDVLRVLKQDVETKDGMKPLWDAKNETANRVRGRIERILGAAAIRQLRSVDNPARLKGHLDNVLPKRSEVRTVEGHAAMPYADIAAFMVELKERKGDLSCDFAGVSRHTGELAL